MTYEGIKKGTTMIKYIFTLILGFTAQAGMPGAPNSTPPQPINGIGQLPPILPVAPNNAAASEIKLLKSQLQMLQAKMEAMEKNPSAAPQNPNLTKEQIKWNNFINEYHSLGQAGYFGQQYNPRSPSKVFRNGRAATWQTGGDANNQPAVSTRDNVRRKLMNIRLREVASLEGFTLAEAVDVLDSMFGKANGINFFFDTTYDPEKNAKNPNENKPNNNGQQVGPTTGLPMGLGLGDGASAGTNIDPTTGLPQGSNAPLGNGPSSPLPSLNGLPPLGGLAPALPLQMQLPVQQEQTFDPDEVKIAGMPPTIYNVTAMQLLNMVAKQTNPPLAFRVGETGVVFMKADPKLRGLSVRTFNLNLNSRTLQQLGVKSPKLENSNPLGMRGPLSSNRQSGINWSQLGGNGQQSFGNGRQSFGNGQQSYGNGGFYPQRQQPQGGNFFRPRGPNFK